MQGYIGQSAPDGHPVQLIVLRNERGCSARFMDWGATWLSCRVPIKNTDATNLPAHKATEGMQREVLLRNPTLVAHLEQKGYLGATVGRYANRIAQATYVNAQMQGAKPVQLVANECGNSLHGGPCGFDSRRWPIESYDDTKVVFRLISADGDQGFPGHLEVRACYELTPDNAISVTFEARTDKPSPVNLSSHAYFNLASSHDSVLSHQLQIFADQFVPVHESGIPRAGLSGVAGTSFDFRAGKQVGQELMADQEQRCVKGYDHCFLLDSERVASGLPIARLSAPDAKVRLAVTTSKPALQLYTANHLGGLLGATGYPFAAHAGVTLETQFLPDSPNHPEWPHASSILLPGQHYSHQTTFHFATS